MCSRPPGWGFHPVVPRDRVERLCAVRSYDQVMDLVLEGKLAAYAWEAFREARLRGCHRASFKLCVSSEAYDSFFNSPVGYRAQYALSPAEGKLANRRLLQLLHARLLEYADSFGGIKRDIAMSLLAEDAKVWILEAEVHEQLGIDQPAIAYSPWELESEDGAGLLAPCGATLEINGGWLDADGLEIRDPCKAHRAEDIHRVGFS